MIQARMDLQAHPQDGDLLRYLDGELDPAGESQIHRHIDRCQRCAGALRTLEKLSDDVETLLEEPLSDPPVRVKEEITQKFAARAGMRRDPRRAHWAHRLARAAIVILALGGPALAVEPVRAWLVERVAAAREALLATPKVPAAKTEDVTRAPSTVSFVPAPGTFFIDIAEPQQAGVLQLTVQEGRVASARVTGTSGAEGLLVLPNRLRIMNDGSSVAEYSVTLPSRLGEIRVSIGDVETLSLHTRGLEVPASWTFGLDGGR